MTIKDKEKAICEHFNITRYLDMYNLFYLEIQVFCNNYSERLKNLYYVCNNQVANYTNEYILLVNLLYEIIRKK